MTRRTEDALPVESGFCPRQTMNTLSRREEEALEKSVKARAIKECDPFLKGMPSVCP